MLQKIVLVSEDEVVHTIDKDTAFQSQVIKNLIEDLDPEEESFEIPLPNIDSATLSIIISWCQHQVSIASTDGRKESRTINASPQFGPSPEVLNKWTIDFLGQHQEYLYSVIMGADYLNIAKLRCHAIKYLAQQLKTKNTDQMQKALRNDWS